MSASTHHVSATLLLAALAGAATLTGCASDSSTASKNEARAGGRPDRLALVVPPGRGRPHTDPLPPGQHRVERLVLGCPRVRVAGPVLEQLVAHRRRLDDGRRRDDCRAPGLSPNRPVRRVGLPQPGPAEPRAFGSPVRRGAGHEPAPRDQPRCAVQGRREHASGDVLARGRGLRPVGLAGRSPGGLRLDAAPPDQRHLHQGSQLPRRDPPHGRSEPGRHAGDQPGRAVRGVLVEPLGQLGPVHDAGLGR